MIVVEFETWAASQGASRQGYGDAGMHSPAAHIGRANWAAKMRMQAQRADDLSQRRDALRIEYDRLVAAGEMRPPTHREKCIATASGNPDRSDVQAARRLCHKLGYL